MTNVLITGGLGFLGQHILTALLKETHVNSIVVLARSQKRLFYHELENEKIRIIYDTDITKKETIEAYFKNIDYVIHAAAKSSFWYKDKKKLFDMNVTGTKNIAELCIKYKIIKLIYVGSTAAIKGSQDYSSPADETNDYDWRLKSKYHYGLSKYYAEKELLNCSSSGLKYVIASPCGIIGYGDKKLFPLIASVSKGFNICMSGGFSVVDVRDVAKGIVLLIKKGRNGERYLFVKDNYTQKQLIEKLARILKKKPKVIVVSYLILIPFIPFIILNEILSKKSPLITKTVIQINLLPSYYSSKKAKSELGWKPSYSIEESLNESIRYYTESNK